MPGMPMPMPGGGMGGPPPTAGGMDGPPGGTSAASVPQPMGGSTAHAMTGLKIALEALQKSLPAIPMGSKLHSAVMKAIQDVTKEMDGGLGGDPASQIQQLMAMARNAQSDPRRAAMMSSLPAPGGAGGGASPPPAPGGPPGGPPGM